MPQSIAGIRESLTRDRRDKERRWGKRDSRVFRYDRRGSERRLGRDTSESGVDDDMIIEIRELVADLELLSIEAGKAELTCIRQRPDID
jgi:hypothetical protein